MKRAIAVAVLFLCGIAAAQSASVVDEAKAKITKQKHETMVEHAKSLLEKKSELEAELATVNAKLEKLENGQDVKVEEAGGFAFTGATTTSYVACCYGSCACLSH